MSSEVTVAELARLLASHLEQAQELQRQMSAMCSTVAVLAERVQRQEDSIQALVTWQTWAMRLVLSLVVTGVLVATLMQPR